MNLGQPISYGQEPTPRSTLQDLVEGKVITHVVLDPTGWDDLGYVEGWPTAAFEFDSAEVLLVSGVPNLTVGAAYSSVLPMVWIPAPFYLTKSRALVVQRGLPELDVTDVQQKLCGKLVRHAYLTREATRDGAEQQVWEFSDKWTLWVRAGRRADNAMAGTLELELVDPETHISLPSPALDVPRVSQLNERVSIDEFSRVFRETPKAIVEP